MKAVCVYCGSAPGLDPRHAALAGRLGRLLASEGLDLVYGGGAVGLMGALADASLAAGGRVVGVLPRGLFTREVPHTGLTELHEVASMHERKQLMVDLADAFVALPGGLGTLEELAEALTWSQLGIHRKPVAVLDETGFWAPLAAWLEAADAEGFLRPESRAMLLWVDRLDGLLPALRSFPPPPARVEAGLSRREL